MLNDSISPHFRRPSTCRKPPSPVAISFIEYKKPQTHLEASLLVPTEVGKGVESLLEQDSKPNCQVIPFTSLCKCWLPYPQNHITGNAPYGTGNATHTGAVIFKGDITGTSAAKAGSPYPQTYFTGIAPKYDVQYR
jgi:hypothetical protein